VVEPIYNSLNGEYFCTGDENYKTFFILGTLCLLKYCRTET